MQKRDDPQSTPPYDPKIHHPTIWSPAYDHLNPILLGWNFQLWALLETLSLHWWWLKQLLTWTSPKDKNRGKRDDEEYAKIIICKLDPETLKQWSCRPSHMLPTSLVLACHALPYIQFHTSFCLTNYYVLPLSSNTNPFDAFKYQFIPTSTLTYNHISYNIICHIYIPTYDLAYSIPAPPYLGILLCSIPYLAYTIGILLYLAYTIVQHTVLASSPRTRLLPPHQLSCYAGSAMSAFPIIAINVFPATVKSE